MGGISACCATDDRKGDAQQLKEVTKINLAKTAINNELEYATPHKIKDSSGGMIQSDSDQEKFEMEPTDKGDHSKVVFPKHANALIQKQIGTARESDLGTITSVADGEESIMDGRDVSPIPSARTDRLASAALTTEPTYKLDEMTANDLRERLVSLNTFASFEVFLFI